MSRFQPSRDVQLSEPMTKDDWIAACEVAETEWESEGRDPDHATLYLMFSDDEVPESISLGLTALAGIRQDATTEDIEVVDSGGEPEFLLAAWVRCSVVRRAFGVPRWDYERQRYVALR